MNWNVLVVAWAYHAAKDCASKASQDFLHFANERWNEGYSEQEGQLFDRYQDLVRIRENLLKELGKQLTLMGTIPTVSDEELGDMYLKNQRKGLLAAVGPFRGTN